MADDLGDGEQIASSLQHPSNCTPSQVMTLDPGLPLLGEARSLSSGYENDLHGLGVHAPTLAAEKYRPWFVALLFDPVG